MAFGNCIFGLKNGQDRYKLVAKETILPLVLCSHCKNYLHDSELICSRCKKRTDHGVFILTMNTFMVIGGIIVVGSLLVILRLL